MSGFSVSTGTMTEPDEPWSPRKSTTCAPSPLTGIGDVSVGSPSTVAVKVSLPFSSVTVAPSTYHSPTGAPPLPVPVIVTVPGNPPSSAETTGYEMPLNVDRATLPFASTAWTNHSVASSETCPVHVRPSVLESALSLNVSEPVGRYIAYTAATSFDATTTRNAVEPVATAWTESISGRVKSVLFE